MVDVLVTDGTCCQTFCNIKLPIFTQERLYKEGCVFNTTSSSWNQKSWINTREQLVFTVDNAKDVKTVFKFEYFNYDDIRVCKGTKDGISLFKLIQFKLKDKIQECAYSKRVLQNAGRWHDKYGDVAAMISYNSRHYDENLAI